MDRLIIFKEFKLNKLYPLMFYLDLVLIDFI